MKIPILALIAALAAQPALAMIPRSSGIKRISYPTAMPFSPLRHLYTANGLKHLYNGLTDQAKPISPVHGAAAYESGFLKRFNTLGVSEWSSHALMKSLFTTHEVQFRPTPDKSNAAYALTPPILGSILGSLEKGTFHNPTAQKQILEQWRAEYKKMCNGDKISNHKVTKMLELIGKNYQEDPCTARAVLLGFLYAKATTKQDMIHYLQNADTHIETLKQSTKENIVQLLQDNYTDKEHMTFESHLTSMSEKDISKSSFEHTVSTLTRKQRGGKPYPPQVIQSFYSFKEQKPRPNCVEAALQDLFNLLVFNQRTQKFDFSLLPSTIKIHPELAQFYNMQNYNIELINHKNTGQAWMNLVSGHDFITYKTEGNHRYEMRSACTPANLLALANYLFSIKAKDLAELGSLLSTPERAISFTLNSSEIETTILERVINATKHANLHFREGHAYLKVPAQDIKSQPLSFIIKWAWAYSSATYGKNQNLTTLFFLIPWIRNGEPDIRKNTEKPTPINPHAYYAFNLEDPNSKLDVIKEALSNIHDSVALGDVAYSLLKTLPDYDNYFIQGAVDAIIQSKADTYHPKISDYFNEITVKALYSTIINHDIFSSTAGDISPLQKILNYAPHLVNAKIETFGTLLHAACGQGHLLAVKELCKRGADVNFNYKYEDYDAKGHGTPFFRTVWNRDRTSRFAIIEELLNNGANVTKKILDESSFARALDDDYISRGKYGYLPFKEPCSKAIALADAKKYYQEIIEIIEKCSQKITTSN